MGRSGSSVPLIFAVWWKQRIWIESIAIETIDEVLIANAEFYSCFEAKSLDRMSEVWEHSDHIRCTHPGWPTLKGWGTVSGSFFNLFHAEFGLQFLLTDTEVRIENDMALVFCTENILGQGLGSSVSSLNIFHLDQIERRWRLIVHHASVASTTFN